MNLRILLISCLVFAFTLAKAEKSYVAVYSRFDKFFSRYVNSKGEVAYKKIRNNPRELNTLTSLIANVEIVEMSEADKKAFYVNTYNFLVIKSVVENFPITSPMDVDGFFSRARHDVAGEMLSLDQIEEQKLLSGFDDIRLMFALSKGVKGAPPLLSEAYLPKKLDRQLDERMKEISNSSEYIRVKKNTGMVLLAEAFSDCWKKLAGARLLEYINKYREEDLPVSYAIDFYPVNRALNLATELESDAE